MEESKCTGSLVVLVGVEGVRCVRQLADGGGRGYPGPSHQVENICTSLAECP